VFEAELITETQIHDPSLPVAIEIKNASFTWDSPPTNSTSDKQKDASGDATDLSPGEKGEEKVFHLDKIDVEVRRGMLLAIVGQVGAGKSSLLQGIIGEMRKTEGTVKFGGSVAYCAQNAWIQVSGHLFFDDSRMVITWMVVRTRPFGIIFVLGAGLKRRK
jgi:ABC-type transport system involved in cytochrome bd biosynthesis fused ATPase/permease subunit